MTRYEVARAMLIGFTLGMAVVAVTLSVMGINNLITHH